MLFLGAGLYVEPAKSNSVRNTRQRFRERDSGWWNDREAKEKLLIQHSIEGIERERDRARGREREREHMKNNREIEGACVRPSVRACVCACVHACVHACMRAACACVRVSVHSYTCALK